MSDVRCGSLGFIMPTTEQVGRPSLLGCIILKDLPTGVIVGSTVIEKATAGLVPTVLTSDF